MDWIPYPTNIPLHEGEYLVSIESYVTIARFEAHVKQYDPSGDKYYGPAWIDIVGGGLHYNVSAFMIKPKFFEV